MTSEPVILLSGDNVALGPLQRDLIPRYMRWVNDLTALRGLGLAPLPMTIDQEASWFDKVTGSSTELGMTIYERASGEPIGNTGLHEINYRNRTATFGILIGEADARGRGYGTETTSLMLDYAFTALGLSNIMLTVYDFNLGAIRAYEKAGFVEFGRRRRAQMMGGTWWDVIYMQACVDDFISPVLGHILTPDPERPPHS